MKKNIAIIITLLISICHILASDTIKAYNPLIEYTGRIDFSDSLAPKFSYSGVSVRAAFQGTSISLILTDEDTSNFYNIILDNVIVSRLKVSKGLKTYPIATGMKDTVHEIEFFRLTELTFGKTSFNGFLVDNGKNLVAISNLRTRLIEYVGNSITCGYGNEGVNGGTFGPTTENHYLTYAAFTSRNFNARHLAVCKSGIGVYRNYGESASGSTDCMTNDYSRVFLFDAKPTYGFHSKPDLICVDLGTNDFSTNNGDSAKFVSKYFSFIDTLQTRNNSADILLLLGPMLSDPDLSKIRRYLNFLVDSSNKNHLGKLYFFEMSQQKGDLGLGIDYHPTVAQHLKNSLELTNYISSIKGWKINPLVVQATISNTKEVIVYFNTNIVDSVNNFGGFSLNSDSVPIEINNVFIDPGNHSLLHITLTDSISYNQKVSLSYIPGSISTYDSLKLGKLSEFNITNNLTETKVSRAYVDKTGQIIYLSFNKSMVKPLSFNGIEVFDKNNNTLQIDSIKYLTATNVQIFLKSLVLKNDTIYITLPAIMTGQDGVLITPLNHYPVLNNSKITSVDRKVSGEIKIFPNPALKKIINYEISENVHGNIVAELYDMNGRLILKRSLSNQKGILDLRNCKKSGTYILKIIYSNNTFQKTILL